jgi:hypothetical protein
VSDGFSALISPASEAPTTMAEPWTSGRRSWRILRKIRSSPNTADKLIAAVQTLMLANA